MDVQKKFCTVCGKPLKAGTNFCTYCGAPVSGVPSKDGPAPSESTKRAPRSSTCPVCHKPVAPGLAYCTSCGAKLEWGGSTGGGRHFPGQPSASGIAPSTPPAAKTTQQSSQPAQRPVQSVQQPVQPAQRPAQPTQQPVKTAPKPAPAVPRPVVLAGGADNKEDNRQAERKARRALVLGVVASLVVALVGVAAVVVWLNGGIDQVLGRFLPGANTETAYFASTDELTVAVSTRILPKLAADDPLSMYTVRVKQADDLDGAALEIDDIPGLSVEGDEGFTLGDFGSLEPGTYWLELEEGDGDGDDGDLYDLPPLTLDSSDTESNPPSELEVLPPAGADDETKLVRRGKYGSYYDVMEGLIQTYGDASLSVLKLDDSKYQTWVAGVSYASLVDFGDGVERLVVMYCTEKEFAASDVIELPDDLPPTDGFGPTVDSYRVEVYEYDEASDEATMVCQMSPANEDGSGEPKLMLVENPDGSTCLIAGPKSADSYGQVCYGIDAEGAFDVLTVGTEEFSRWTVQQQFRFVSLGSSQDAALGDAGAQELSCEDTAQTVKDLTARLKTLAG